MKNAIMPLVFILVLVSSCSGSKSSGKAQEIAQGVYEQAGWIFDMKQLPTGEDIVPYFVLGKLSTNTIKANVQDDSIIEMGVTANFKIGKKGSDKGNIVGVYFESTATNENEFKFPRCLSICPVNIEIVNANGEITVSKATYSRSNVFQMQLEDDVLNTLALEMKKIRVRIPVSIQNKNTTFEWFAIDLSGFNPVLNL
ncbi:MAG: hypothetical protein DA394_03160 [Candidatus Arcticimaribacter sp.]|nr:MAG: hypothetical protein DA394_03160 [Candidatus Arcticimaribacter sp.]